jgi:hypothetical protein
MTMPGKISQFASLMLVWRVSRLSVRKDYRLTRTFAVCQDGLRFLGGILFASRLSAKR